MIFKLVLLSILGVVLSENKCYWNRHCSYQLFSTVTPYDTIRGDIRDFPSPNNETILNFVSLFVNVTSKSAKAQFVFILKSINSLSRHSVGDCKAISVWSLHRHGNRYPGEAIVSDIKELHLKLREEIINSNAENKCLLCSQDIEQILNWKWNFTLDTSPSFLTQIGFDEIYAIGKRIRTKYSDLLFGSNDKYYFRSTDEQRTTASVRAFVQGLTEGTEKDLTSQIDETRARDDIIRPYQNCDLYQNLVKNGLQLTDELAAYDQSPDFLAVRDRVIQRLGITYQLSPHEIFSIYELCRFFRSWSSNLQCPWCSLFTDEDLIVLEYRDDVRHYYKNGYGSVINADLGGPALKDLYENFVAATRGGGKNIVSYFTHDTLMEMVFSALGLFEDSTPIRGAKMNHTRVWRTSYISSFSTNFMAVLNRCETEDTFRVQFFINEEVTSLCPVEGCTWQTFVDVFQTFSNSTLSFCSIEKSTSEETNTTTTTNNYAVSRLASSVLIIVSLLGILY